MKNKYFWNLFWKDNKYLIFIGIIIMAYKIVKGEIIESFGFLFGLFLILLIFQYFNFKKINKKNNSKK